MTGLKRRAGAVAALAGACVLAFAPSALAAPKINASKTTGLKAGDTITVQVTGMTPNETFVTLGQCKPGPKLPNDCAGQDTGGAIVGGTDADGNFITKDKSTSAKIKIVAKAGGVDCTAKAGACVLAVTAPGNQGPNTAEIPLTLAGGGSGGETETVAAARAVGRAAAVPPGRRRKRGPAEHRQPGRRAHLRADRVRAGHGRWRGPAHHPAPPQGNS